MHKDSLLQTRVKSDLKQAADELFCSMGLTTSDAIRIFITECVAKQSFPFEITPSTKKSTGKDFGILNPYASPVKRAKERDAWISALVSAPEMMIGDGLIGDTNIEGDRTYNLSDDECDDFQGSDDMNRDFAFDNELFAGLVNDEPFRRDPCKDDRGKKTEVRKGAGARLPDEESKGAGADTAPMSITEKRISAGSTATGDAQGAKVGANSGTGMSKTGKSTGDAWRTEGRHNSSAHPKASTHRHSASHAKTAPHANANTEHKAHSPHVLKKPLLGENYHAYKEK